MPLRLALSAVLAASALAAAGCGSTVGGPASSGASAPGADAAQLVPASALAFVAVDTDLSSAQRQNLDTLTHGLPLRQQLDDKLQTALAQHGVNLDRDVRPALGPELDLAVLKSTGDHPDVIALARPDDVSKLRALASKFDQGDEHYTVQQVGDWSVVADSPEAFAAVRAARSGTSLGDTRRYAEAQEQLGSDALASVYVDGGALASLPANAKALLGGSHPTWAAAKVDATDHALRISAAADTGVRMPFTSKLLGDVPSGAVLAASFKNGGTLAGQLSGMGGGSALLKQLAPLLKGEGILYVRPSGLLPEVAIELAPANPRATLARVRALLKSQTTRLGPVPVTAQLSAGKVVIADSPSAVSALRGGAKLVHDKAFTGALADAGVPGQRTGLVYANVSALAPLLELLASTGGKPLDPNIGGTLEKLGPLLVWGDRTGGVSRLHVWLQPR